MPLSEAQVTALKERIFDEKINHVDRLAAARELCNSGDPRAFTELMRCLLSRRGTVINIIMQILKEDRSIQLEMRTDGGGYIRVLQEAIDDDHLARAVREQLSDIERKDIIELTNKLEYSSQIGFLNEIQLKLAGFLRVTGAIPLIVNSLEIPLVKDFTAEQKMLWSINSRNALDTSWKWDLIGRHNCENQAALALGRIATHYPHLSLSYVYSGLLARHEMHQS